MRLAFSTLTCPQWTFDEIAVRAREFGYDGVELWGFFTGKPVVAADALAAEPRAILDSLGDLKIAALVTAASMSGRESAPQATRELRRFVDRAVALRCGCVRLPAVSIPPRCNRAAVIDEFARWLAEVGDYAGDHGVQLAVENTGALRRAADLWRLLELVNHPAVGACWDVLDAAMAGETPAVSVPTLNLRIAHVVVRDAACGPRGAEYRPLGEGQVQVRDLLRRLMGIGYDGWVSFEWEVALGQKIGPCEQVLPQALAAMRQWTTPPKPAKPGKAAPATSTTGR